MLSREAILILSTSDSAIKRLPDADARRLRKSVGSNIGVFTSATKVRNWLIEYNHNVESAITDFGYSGTGSMASLSNAISRRAS
jgi:hypothetical protein